MHSDTVKLPRAGCWQDEWLLFCMMRLCSFDFSFLFLGRMKVLECFNCLGDTMDRHCLFQLNIIIMNRISAYQCMIPERQGELADFITLILGNISFQADYKKNFYLHRDFIIMRFPKKTA